MNNSSLDALFSGLTQSESTEKQGLSKQTAPAKEKPVEQPIKAREKQKQQERSKNEERFCSIVSSELLKKIRIIAKREGLPIKDIVDAAFFKAISSYEQRNGEVLENKKKNPKELF